MAHTFTRKVIAKGDGVDCERDGALPHRCGWPMGIATLEAHQLMLAESLGTQEDQNKSDERLRSRALKELVRSWEDWLQLISVITTFFAATEAQLLGFTMPDDDNKSSSVQHAAVAVLVGALVVHLFLAFFLIQFCLGKAKRAEKKVEKNGKMSEGSVYDTHSCSSSPA
ncbi:hypothetical protein WOLCODRAFT_20603 [Wolfiporia cocos MD-104 SS10]|uniref:Uncharacterized protein n=1 Tax=Wolfiporia cocos (strain MD-104) TaxID=742152 RepID=A0A2H3JCT3_WOLCO|nr:hypothetical protein WOLCODRAFT_20603 [Wolfiporia cocos MD-104 SS10]